MANMLHPARRRRYSAVPARVHAVYLRTAPELGTTAGSLAQHTPVYVDRLAHLIAAAAAIPDLAFIERVLAPIDVARAGISAPALTPELIQRVQSADAAEEVAETRYLSNPTKASLRAWRDAATKQRAETAVLILAQTAALRAMDD